MPIIPDASNASMRRRAVLTLIPAPLARSVYDARGAFASNRSRFRSTGRSAWIEKP